MLQLKLLRKKKVVNSTLTKKNYNTRSTATQNVFPVNGLTTPDDVVVRLNGLPRSVCMTRLTKTIVKLSNRQKQMTPETSSEVIEMPGEMSRVTANRLQIAYGVCFSLATSQLSAPTKKGVNAKRVTI